MYKALLAIVGAVIVLAGPVLAQDRVTLGHARLFSNDALGDAKDRWRSGSYMVSRLRGPSWDGVLPSRPGEILEFRLRSEIIAPSDLVTPAPDDRRYAGVLALGLHTHFALGQAEASLGGELVVTGPQTGIGAFHREVHELFDMPEPQVLDDQIPNGIHPTLRAEIGQRFDLGRVVSLRPFVEAQAGVESFVRVGGDMVIGGFGTGALLVRDSVTGHLVEGIAGSDGPGLSFMLGGDVARVFDSAYLPSGGAAVLSDSRGRLRAGLNWQGEKTEVFYGLTWMGKEYEAQPDEQVVGSIRLRLRF